MCPILFLSKKKKKFLEIAVEIINKKLSVENILELSIKFEILKNKAINEEEIKILNKLPLFKINDHLKEDYKI